jgi:hypothetical protein
MLPQRYKIGLQKRLAKATAASSSELVFPKLAEHAGGEPRIRDTPRRQAASTMSRTPGSLTASARMLGGGSVEKAAADLSLNDSQIDMICAAAPYVIAMTQRLRRERDFREEPANIFQFPE